MDIEERRAKKAAYMKGWRARNLEHARVLEKASRDRNREARRLRDREYYAKHKASINAQRKPKSEGDLERGRQWHAANRECLNRRSREYYQAHREEHNARARRWEAEHPERARELRIAKVQRYRARLRAARVEPLDIGEVIRNAQGLCGICGSLVSPDELSIDHIVPISKGGPHTTSNLQLAHLTCNRRKGARQGANTYA